MNKDRNWTILLIGGASGTGKSSIACALARCYEVNVIEIDDIVQALMAMTTKEPLPALNYWDSGVNWLDIGVGGNVDWLTNVSKEIIPALKAVIENHLESGIPVIIEGDFLAPELAEAINRPEVKALFITETDVRQIIENYFAREGGSLQQYRADISIAYNNRLSEACNGLGVPLLESRPWNTAVDRAIMCLTAEKTGL